MTLVRKFPHGICPNCRKKVQMESATKILLWHLHECEGDPNEIFKKDVISPMQRELMNKMCNLAQMELNYEKIKKANVDAKVSFKPKSRFDSYGVPSAQTPMSKYNFKKRR